MQGMRWGLYKAVEKYFFNETGRNKDTEYLMLKLLQLIYFAKDPDYNCTLFNSSIGDRMGVISIVDDDNTTSRTSFGKLGILTFGDQ